MMNMVHTTNGDSFLLLWGIHLIAILAFGVGFAFLVLWAAKSLTSKQLQMWGIGLVVLAIVLCSLTVGQFGGKYMKRIDEKHTMPMEMMDDRMMDHDMDDAMGMSMTDMSAMLEGKTGDAFDKAFIEGMIPHHQGAIDMAEAALRDAKHDEIINMARAIINAQQAEIEQMQGWYDAWGYDQQ